MQLTLTNKAGSYDITTLVDAVTMGGEYRSCSRTLSFGLVSSTTDGNVPEIDCPVGCSVVLEQDGEQLFNGFVVERTKSTAGNTIDLSCMDRGYYLGKTQITKSVNATPEAAVAALCKEFGIPTGYLQKTGVMVKRKFFGTTIYSAIATLYTLAAETTGDVYHVGFEADKLTVRPKGGAGYLPLLKGDSNLMDATITESGDSIVNRVLVLDGNGNTVSTISNDASIKQYGLVQQIIRQTGTEVPLGQAKKLLEKSKVTQKITVNNLGDSRCITGGAVMVDEPYTGLCGLFFIDADTHTWKNGLYISRLTLNLQAVMDEQSAGELLQDPTSEKVTAAVKAEVIYRTPQPKAATDFRVGHNLME